MRNTLNLLTSKFPGMNTGELQGQAEVQPGEVSEEKVLPSCWVQGWKQLCQRARVVGAQPRPKPEGTPTLTQVWNEARVAQSQPPKSVVSLPPPPPAATSGGTRGFPRYPLEHPDLQQFICYLQGLDGKRKSEREAQMCQSF